MPARDIPEERQVGHTALRFERILVAAILRPAALPVVASCELRAGDRVVDVGCGTGAATRLAAEIVGHSGRVAAIDVSAGMIEAARSLPPPEGAAVEWLEANAEELPFPDEAFDAAICAQTLQFLSNRPDALHEMRRVVASDGRIAASTWCGAVENPYFEVLASVSARRRLSN